MHENADSVLKSNVLGLPADLFKSVGHRRSRHQKGRVWTGSVELHQQARDDQGDECGLIKVQVHERASFRISRARADTSASSMGFRSCVM